MNLVFNYLINPFLIWGTSFFGLTVIFIAALKRFYDFKFISKIIPTPNCWVRGLSYKFLIWLVLGFKVLYASIETFSQYYIWSNNGFTKLFLDQNIIDFDIVKDLPRGMTWIFDNRFGYFLFYSWGRFWMEIAVSLVAALAFYLFLRFLKKHKERFFEEGEVELGFLLALVVGWSNFIIFLPLVFLSVVLVSIFRTLAFKEAHTTLGAPFLLAALIVLLFGKYIVDILGLTMLRV
ncbi:MAG: hypothetical protein Q7S81_01725 [bacterium]|nr:hypothetical protein [bacterium]